MIKAQDFMVVTRADGEKVYVISAHVAAWERAPGGSAQTAIILDSGTVLYVKDTPSEILDMLVEDN
jgi:hypothetical protein